MKTNLLLRLSLFVCLSVLTSALSAADTLADMAVPDPAITPGVVSDLTAEQICDREWTTRDVRRVTPAMKRAVATAYGFQCRPLFKGEDLPACSTVEFDHLISLELGGSNDVRNLWIQPMPQARLKDKLETRLHRLVCQNKMTLEQAQTEIRQDWRAAYRRLFEPLEE